MKEDSSKLRIAFLVSFFKLFDATIKNINIDSETIEGTLLWGNEEDTQEISWPIPHENIEFNDLIELIDYILTNKLMEGDKITISEKNLIQKLNLTGWDSQKATKSINDLCNISIKMVNNGAETDSFFIHF